MRLWACIFLGVVGLLSSQVVRSAPGLKIGLLARPDDASFQSICRGVSLALSNWNATATTPIQLVVRGRPGQWGTDGDEAAVLALDESVDVVIASEDGALTHQAEQVSGRTQVPVLSFCADSSVTRTGIPWAARVVPSTIEEARCIFRSANANTAREWVILIPPGRPGRESASDLRCAARDSGNRILREFCPVELKKDLTLVLNQIVELRPGGVVVWLDAQAASEAVRGLRARHYDGVLAGPAQLRSAAFITLAGASAEGFVVPYPAPNAEALRRRERFDAEFKQSFGTSPDWLGSMAYDATKLLARNGTKLNRRDFLSVQESDGLFGPIRFDAAGNRLLPLVAQVCVRGEFR